MLSSPLGRFGCLSVAALLMAPSGLVAQFAVNGDGQPLIFEKGGKTQTWVVSPSECCVKIEGKAPRIQHVNLPPVENLLEVFVQMNEGMATTTEFSPALQDAIGEEPLVQREISFHPVVYRNGRLGVMAARGILRATVNLILDGADPAALAQVVGADSFEWVVDGRAAVLHFSAVHLAVGALDALAATEGVSEAYPEISGTRKKLAIPNDPLFTYSPQRVNYQWHLRNVGVNGGVEGVDVNITDVWDNYTGAGVAIGIVDDGLQTLHPDLFLNVDFANDWDFNGEDDNPNPLNDTLDGIVDSHGTSVAGVAAARWNNGIGGTGSAPLATLVGLRVLGDVFTTMEQDFAAAVGWDNGNIAISNNSWGPGNPTAFWVDGLVLAAIEEDVVSARGGLGRIFCFAAGNDGAVEGNTNHYNVTAAPETIAVGALNDDGTRSFFSTPGASLTISAPSGGSATQQQVTTTTLTNISGGYTSTFSGTSSATPLVSGCIALMLEANPGLGWRDVQEILIRTARKNQPLDPGWATNGADLFFNHKFGAGMIDAEAAVTMAETWTNLPARQMVEIERTDFTIRIDPPDGENDEPTPVGTVIPDAGVLEASIDASNFTSMRVEHAILNLDVVHPNRNELEVTLIAPSGMDSLVLDNFVADPEEDISYEFPLATVRSWGEDFSGIWRVRIRDTVGGQQGEVLQMRLTVYGTTPDDMPPRQLPGLEGERRITFRTNEFAVVPLVGTPDGATVDVTAGDLPDGLTFDPGPGVVFGAPSELGEFPVEVTVTNGPDSRAFIVVFVVGESPGSTLGEAIEQSSASTTTSGIAGPWFVDLDTTFDGSDAVASPLNTPNNFHSQLQFNNPQSGVMTFAWRTSSEENADRLWLHRQGTDYEQQWMGFISGERNWGRMAVPVSGGQRYNWRFQRNGFGSAGLNQSWIDSVSIVPVSEFMQNIKDVLDTTEAISPVGKAYWLVAPSIVDGTVQEVVRSPSIGNGQHAGLALTVQGPVTLKFDWKVDAAPGDFFYLLVNGNIARSIQGFADWSEVEFDLPAGSNQVEWRYSKDASFSFSADGAFLLNVEVQPVVGYLAWLAEFLSPEQLNDPLIAAADADSDEDGWTNFEEYVYGGDPLVANPGTLPGAPAIVEDGLGGWVYRFEVPVANEDLLIEVEESGDLQNWAPAAGLTVNQVGDVIRYEVAVVPGGSNYFHITATQIPVVSP